MQVCSNTSPLSNLAIIGRLDCLFERHPLIHVPEAVWSELSALTNTAALGALEDARAEGRLRVEVVTDRRLVNLLLVELDLGEAEAIALASEQKADLLLMDEHDGRSIALRLGLVITGVLGLLLDAKLKGRLPCLQTEIDQLRQTARFFISESLAAELLRKAGE